MNWRSRLAHRALERQLEYQERKAEHIMKGYRKEGVSKKEAEERAWRTVNKQDKGGKNDGSGRSSSRSAAAKKGWETRRRRGNG